MVDVGAVARKARRSQTDCSGTLSAKLIELHIRPADDYALADYEAFCSNATHAQAQHPLWVRAWITATGADVIVVSVQNEGRPVLMLAIEVASVGPFRIAGFLGGPHANGNFPPFSTAGGHVIGRTELETIRDAISNARPDIDLICLERQVLELRGTENPFAPYATMRSANIALATDLTDGMDAMLARMNGKRKRKKLRYTANKFQEAGGHRWIEANSPEEVETLLTAFFEMKAMQFRKRGIVDPFASKEVRRFFLHLFTDALKQSPAPFVLQAVEVGGEITGVNGYSVTEHSLICEFCAIRDGDAALSPGFYLDYVAMEEACRRGKAIYDFSVGDDDYKRSWCDIETVQFDLLLPLNVKGRVAATVKIARARAISAIKSNRQFWTLAKVLRKRVVGRRD